MVKYFYKSVRDETLQEREAPQRGCWVYIESPTDIEVAEAIKRFNLEPGLIEDALDEDEMPRLEQEDGKSYIFVRFAYKRSDGEMDTAPLLIIFDKENVITISGTHLPALDSFLRNRYNFATTQRAKLVMLMLTHISGQYDTFINRTSRKIKAIRSRLRGHGIRQQDLIDFVTIEDELNEFLASLLPTNATLRRLLISKHLDLFDEDQDLVEDLLLNNEQSIEAIRANLRSVENIRNAYTAVSSDQLNKTITLLTLATILIAIPNVFFSMYGMNIDLPFQKSHWVFEILLGINLLIFLVVALIFRKRRRF